MDATGLALIRAALLGLALACAARAQAPITYAIELGTSGSLRVAVSVPALAATTCAFTLSRKAEGRLVEAPVEALRAVAEARALAVDGPGARALTTLAWTSPRSSPCSATLRPTSSSMV